MDWEKFATVFGLPGLMIAAAVLILREFGARAERFRMQELADKKEVRLRELAVEDKKADAMVAAMGSISTRVEAHHTADISSHRELGEGIAEIRGKLDEAIASRSGTPVRGVPVAVSEYSHGRPRSRSDGDR